jgi:HSP20 family molecular chaperone IbpA
MILLRRGLRTQTLESSFELDVMVDFGHQPTTSRYQCLAPWRPPIDVFETGNGLVVRAELGGLIAGEVQVLLSGDQLILRGERDVVRTGGHRVYHESRVRYGRFEAAIRLPFAVDGESATAEYADGFLSIELPRLAPVKLPTGREREVV